MSNKLFCVDVRGRTLAEKVAAIAKLAKLTGLDKTNVEQHCCEYLCTVNGHGKLSWCIVQQSDWYTVDEPYLISYEDFMDYKEPPQFSKSDLYDGYRVQNRVGYSRTVFKEKLWEMSSNGCLLNFKISLSAYNNDLCNTSCSSLDIMYVWDNKGNLVWERKEEQVNLGEYFKDTTVSHDKLKAIKNILGLCE